jgi:hypothetical protein
MKTFQSLLFRVRSLLPDSEFLTENRVKSGASTDKKSKSVAAITFQRFYRLKVAGTGAEVVQIRRYLPRYFFNAGQIPVQS